MIFVTVGMHYQGFPRLIEKMDEIAGKINEKVVMQIGATEYVPKNAEHFDFKAYSEMQELNREARVVVCHDGAGSIITAMQYSKPIVVVPRWKKYGEVAYNNQADLAVELEKEGKLKVVYEMDNLEEELNDISTTSMKIERDKMLVKALKEYINDLNRTIKT